MRKVKQIVKQKSDLRGVPGGIRTHDPLLRRHFLKLIVHNLVNSWD